MHENDKEFYREMPLGCWAIIAVFAIVFFTFGFLIPNNPSFSSLWFEFLMRVVMGILTTIIGFGFICFAGMLFAFDAR